MNDTQTDSPPIAGAAASVARRRGLFNGWMLAALLAVVLMAWTWFDTRREVDQVREDIARRLQEAETAAREARANAQDARQGMREMQGKLSVLEARIAEAQGQQTALEQLYQELSRSRDESMLSETEQILSVASQQLQLSGNVQGALLALQGADARLARSDRPQFIPIRRALARDIDRLKALPNVDITGLVLRLDQIAAGLDRLPMIGDARVPAAPAPESEGRFAWTAAAAMIWSEVRQLVRIQRTDGQDTPLLAPDQSYFVRENIRLRLLNARLALLQRNEPVFKADLGIADQWLARYFDGTQKTVVATRNALRELRSAGLTVELPNLGGSLAAVRNLKAASEKPR